jgi:putative hydrolase of the HAD superfamily
MALDMRNIIFDLGGVVLDWNPDTIIRLVFDDPEIQAVIRREVFEHPDWLETDRGTLIRAEAIVRWAERTGRPVEEIDALMRAADDSMQPKTDTLALMDELTDRHLKLFCLSNMPAERYAYLRRKFDFWPQFSGIVISAHVRMIKPEPGIFQHLLTTYELEPATTLFVDDSPHNIEAASALGLQGVLFTSAAECREQLERFL